jgi:hypothetical protein
LFVIRVPPLPVHTGQRADPFDHPGYSEDLILDLGNRAQREGFALIGVAEGAPIPGAVSGHPDQETPGFTRRPDRPLFNAVVILFFIHDSYPAYFSDLLGSCNISKGILQDCISLS